MSFLEAMKISLTEKIFFIAVRKIERSKNTEAIKYKNNF